MSETEARKTFPEFQITMEVWKRKWAHVISDPSKLTSDQSVECFADAAFVPDIRDWALDRLWTGMKNKEKLQHVVAELDGYTKKEEVPTD